MLTARLGAVERRLAAVPKPLAWAMLAAWYALIFALSHTPAGPGPGGTWRNFLLNLGHAPLFAVLGVWIAVCTVQRGAPGLSTTGRRAAWMLALVLASGIFDEVHQSMRPGRNASVLDLATDCFGAASLYWILALPAREQPGDGALVLRAALGALACALSALAATAADALLVDVPWL